MPAVLFAAMFFRAAPVDMPLAEAYLVTATDGTMRLEDRYDEFELWMSRAILGRWADEDGRILTVAKLDTVAPAFDVRSMTREEYVANMTPIYLRDDALRRDAADALSPFPVADKPSAPAAVPRGMKKVEYWRGTNDTAVVCTFLPLDSRAWYYASWELLEGDSVLDAERVFDDEFIGAFSEIVERGDLRSEKMFLENKRAYQSKKSFAAEAGGKTEASAMDERELLRADAAHSVSNYPSWRVTHAREFTILDNLRGEGAFIAALTNELGAMRVLYAKMVPSPLQATNTLAVARIYSSRAEYLAALGENDVSGMEWSAAYWSPARRELVAYLPDAGAAELLQTVRHEAFHQYLSYATAMIPASPWFNEGYAQYFEDMESADWGMEVDIDAISKLIAPLMEMDYVEFYSGSAIERRLKYRMAWSIAHFIENGAQNVRNKPFARLKENYVGALLKTHDMSKATSAAFDGEGTMTLFAEEWKKFWEKR